MVWYGLIKVKLVETLDHATKKFANSGNTKGGFDWGHSVLANIRSLIVSARLVLDGYRSLSVYCTNA